MSQNHFKRKIAVFALGLWWGGTGCYNGNSRAEAGETSGGDAEGGDSEASDENSTGGASDGQETGDTDADDDDEGTPSTTTRRLSNHEIALSIHALTGLQPAALSRLPPEGDGFVFDRIVNGQTISRPHIEAYMAIADEVVATLLAEQRLDDLADACADEILPPAAAQTLSRASGSGLTGAPEWACSVTEEQPEELFCLYSEAPTASISHNFIAPGTYEVELDVNVTASTPTVEVRVGADLVATQSLDAGDSTITATVEVTQATATPIVFEFSNATANLGVRFQELRVRGPLDPNAGVYDVEQRACGAAVLDAFAPVAFRRPLTDAQRERLQGLFDSGNDQSGFTDGLRMLFEGILANPSFLYLVEIGEPVEGEQGMFALGPWELAARLSYSLCESPPDAPLRQVAASGEIMDDDVITLHARRLLAQSCGRDTVRRFYEQWLNLDRLHSVNKSPEVFPEFDDEVRAGLISEVRRFLDEMVWQEAASFEDFFSTQLAWPDPRSAHLSGLDGVTTQQRVTLGEERSGVLTLPALMASTGEFDGTSPVTRGVFVLEHLLCTQLPPPPEDVEIVPPPPDPDLSTRERWEAHSSLPECAGCHVLIDPPGFALEDFDGIGRHRTMDNGVPVDASGGAVGIDEDVEVVGGAALSRALATSGLATDCFARQWLRFALGRLDQPLDAETLDALAAAATTQEMSEVFVAITASDAFRHRFEASP